MDRNDDRTFGERVSDSVSAFGGSWKFIISFSVVLIIWLIVNTAVFFTKYQFDAYPYILLNLVLSFVAAFQAPFIMMSQNRAEKKQDEAYRTLFREIKELIQNSIEIENTTSQMIQIDHDDEMKYRTELHELTRTIKDLVETDHREHCNYQEKISTLNEMLNVLIRKNNDD